MVAHKNAHIIIITAIIVAKHKKLIVKLGGAVGRFGDYLCVDCANSPCESGHNQYTNTNSPDLLTSLLIIEAYGKSQ